MMDYLILGNMILFWIFMFLGLRAVYQRNSLMEYKFNIESSIDEGIPNLLNSIINEAFDEYMILNEGYKDNIYVDKDREESILRGVGELVAMRMSKSLQLKLATYYDTDAIESVISDKIYILVMNHVIDSNSTKEDKEDL